MTSSLRRALRRTRWPEKAALAHATSSSGTAPSSITTSGGPFPRKRGRRANSFATATCPAADPRQSLELNTSENLQGARRRRLCGALGLLPSDTHVEFRPREDRKGVFTPRRWSGPRFAIAHEGRMVWLRFPGGTARLVQRRRVRPVTNDSRMVLELKERVADRMAWTRDRHLRGCCVPELHSGGEENVDKPDFPLGELSGHPEVAPPAVPTDPGRTDAPRCGQRAAPPGQPAVRQQVGEAPQPPGGLPSPPTVAADPTHVFCHAVDPTARRRRNDE